MRLGDLDALKAILFNDTQYGFWHDSMDGSDVAYTQRDIFRCIDAIPTIDAVPVVRCKDCKYWLKDVAGCTDNVGRCEWANYMVGAVGYCVYGEREDGE